MNYLKPYGFLNNLKCHFRKRHTADIRTQYEIYSIRTFDFHIDFTKTDRAYFKYDGISYETFSVYEVLNYLNKKGDTQVRIVFEGKNKVARFCSYCAIIERIYPKIHFFGGYRAYDLKELYSFKNSYITSKIDWYERLD